MKPGKEADTLTGGVEAALTTKELFLEETNDEWVRLAPIIFLADSTEEARDDDTSACVAIFPPFPSSSSPFLVHHHHTRMALIDRNSRLQ